MGRTRHSRKYLQQQQSRLAKHVAVATRAATLSAKNLPFGVPYAVGCSRAHATAVVAGASPNVADVVVQWHPTVQFMLVRKDPSALPFLGRNAPTGHSLRRALASLPQKAWARAAWRFRVFSRQLAPMPPPARPAGCAPTCATVQGSVGRLRRLWTSSLM